LTVLLINFLGGKPDVLNEGQIMSIIQNGDIQANSVVVQTNGVHLIIKGIYVVDGKLHEFVYHGMSYST
jgi:hypothetical protein